MKKISEKKLNSSKKLLIDEWQYCKRMIEERIEEAKKFDVDNIELLNNQHKVMSTVRGILGKGYYYMTDDYYKKYNKERIEKAISYLSNAIDEINYK